MEHPAEGRRVLKTFRLLPAQLWANRAGSTTEVIGFEESAPLLAGVAPWRLSVASLEFPAEFSVLPGLERTFTPVGGRVRLSVEGRLHTVGDGEQLRFAGEDVVEITDLDRPCAAVNLMSRRVPGLPRVEARTLGAGEATPSPGPVVWVNLETGMGTFDLLEGPLGAGRALGLFGPA
ncbi:hypothetical protein DWB68_04400 [Galactobacter valiniphilus]|uniref:HutD family protein n=1 Tax=Galactobacter valiniphilus TaxID=2676122 RepID=A0A399JKJ1_9MICC|nr:HutD family protein [Galactobacter valiniphilus]RII43026.1 hypothetical protein DWB68_04400 [Galactobacter valiniphilus]